MLVCVCTELYSAMSSTCDTSVFLHYTREQAAAAEWFVYHDVIPTSMEGKHLCETATRDTAIELHNTNISYDI